MDQQSIRYDDQPSSSHSDASSRSPSISPAIPITAVSTANENWRGKNDPHERRRIQNRLNQRSYRQRQRAGETSQQTQTGFESRPSRPLQHRSPLDRSEESAWASGASASNAEGSTAVVGRTEALAALASANAPPVSVADSDNAAGLVWDELGSLINSNFMTAATANAARVGIDAAALRSGTPILTPVPFNARHNYQPRSPPPPSLQPVQLQHRVPHDPILDALPHARLRDNVLRALAAGEPDAAAFARHLRGSGGLGPGPRPGPGTARQRGGVVVWGAADDAAGWELSETLVRRWPALLRGCADLLDSSNAWRAQRGERPLIVETGDLDLGAPRRW